MPELKNKTKKKCLYISTSNTKMVNIALTDEFYNPLQLEIL